MAEQKIRLVMLRALFTAQPTKEDKDKGYYFNIYYDLWIKQEGEGFWVKRGDERVKGESKKFYPTLWDLTEDWGSYRFKYIRDK